MISLSEHIKDSCKSIVVRRKESIDCFRNTGRFRCRNEEQQDSQYGETQGYQVCLAFAGHLIIAEKAEAQSAEKGNDQSRQGENAEENIGHQEANEEYGQENEGQIIGNEGGVHMTAHIIQPVSQVETEEAQGNEGQEDDFIPYAGEPVSVLTQPVEKYTNEEACNTADDVVEIFRNKFYGNHGNGSKDGARDYPAGNLTPGGSFFFRHISPHLCQNFRHEKKKENGQSGERIDKKGNKDKENGNKDFISLKHLQVLEI